ncbi:MAG TPA: toxin-antitoxin system, toxin component, HicA family protein [Planctomycetes bacterium]|nr:toxin-antitoxin system, toxin component, HicA family protein [Planctomycetota bacterium]
MKRRDLLARLAELGWRFDRQGGAHEIWRKGERSMAVPRHTEINEHTARAILRDAAR